MFWPSTYPRSRRPELNASNSGDEGLPEDRINPILRSFFVGFWAATGALAATETSSKAIIVL